MKKQDLGLIMIILTLMPLVSADLAIPAITQARIISSMVILVLGVLLIEWISIYLLIKKLFKQKISLGRAFLMALVANIITTTLGFPLTDLVVGITKTDGYLLLFFALIISVIIEFVVYTPFTNEVRGVNKKKLFLISLITNIMSYLFLIVFGLIANNIMG